MGLLLVLFKHKITNLKLVKLDLFVKCSLKTFLINLVMLNHIDMPLIKHSKLVQLGLMSFLIRDKILERHAQGGDFKLKRHGNLDTINERERSSSYGHLNASVICPQSVWETLMPVTMITINHFLENHDNYLVQSLNLTITLGVIRCGERFLDMISITHSPHMLILKINTLISNDSYKNTKLTYDMSLYEIYDLRTHGRDQGNCLYPLGKLISGNDNELMTIKRRKNKLIDEIKTPLGEGPHVLDGMKRLRKHVLKMGMLLTLDSLTYSLQSPSMVG